MLKKLRKKKTAKKVWIILCILILPAFLLWGSGSIIRSRQETNYAGLESQAWERLMLLAEAKKQKITANDTEVIQQLASLALFKDNQGNFDNTRYAQILRYYFRTSPRVFEEQLRQNLIIAKLYQQLTNGITLSEEEIKENYKKVNEEMRFDYIAAAPSDFAKEINVSEEEVKNYFSKNSLQFKQPLSFNIEYAIVAADTKDENAIQQKLKELMLRLKKKEDFKKVALDFGIEVKETGLFTQTEVNQGKIAGYG
ncbi:MAG: SurA N-terminal domain-containing protein [Candidatus Omnitrophica bacterium]|nr:SurA N-terminal domain-containing protein [Candidatus Omnitrophota bacterium]